MSTFQRAHLLVRSLACYGRQEFPKSELELVVIDDSSTDHTYQMVWEWANATGIKTVYLRPYPKGVNWRDCGAVLNYGIRASSGKHVLLTHPEVMPGRTSVLDCVKRLDEFERGRIDQGEMKYRSPIGLYTCCRVYYLSPRDQVLLDSVNWQEEGNLAVRGIDQFYEADTNGHPDYCHRATDVVAQPGSRLPKWESWVFGGCSRETWKRLGGMLTTQQWGAVDIAWTARRRALGIPNHTCPDGSAICIHQNHNLPGDVETIRDESKWKEELRSVDLMTTSKLIYPAIDELGW
jgi:hypothetical protein